MRIIVIVVGWLVFLFGGVSVVVFIIGGTGDRDTQVLVNPMSNVMVAGAILVLAGIAAGKLTAAARTAPAQAQSVQLAQPNPPQPAAPAGYPNPGSQPPPNPGMAQPPRH